MSRVDRGKHIRGQERNLGPVRLPGRRRIGLRVPSYLSRYDYECALIDAAFGYDHERFHIQRGYPPYVRFRRGDMGYHSQDESDVPWPKREANIIKSVGVPMPESYSVFDMLDIDGPIVAKIYNAQRGEGKYLLRTREEKLRMAAFCLLRPEISEDLLTDPNTKASKIRLDQLTEKIARGDINGVEFLPKSCRAIKFEEYIETPSNKYTSFRIVVDAYGNIYSILLIYSAQDKLETQDTVRQMATDSRVAVAYDYYLLSRESPFYIPAPPIVSNHAQGGGQINFMYSEHTDEQTRELHTQILHAHGLDPDNPKLPEMVLEWARQLGKAFRKEGLYTGIDFVMNRNNGKFIILEMNQLPHIDPEDIGRPNAKRSLIPAIMMARILGNAQNDN